MNHVENPSIESNYQFQSWSKGLSRANSSLPLRTPTKTSCKLSIDNRSRLSRTESSSTTTASTTRRIFRHHLRVPTATRLRTPSVNNASSDKIVETNTLENSSFEIKETNLPNSTLIQVNSNDITFQDILKKNEDTLKKFPKDTYEQRKLAHEGKKRKQQAQTLVEKYSESETWFQLRKSLTELKRLATNDEILVDPTTSYFNCDGYSFAALKQVIASQDEDKKADLLLLDSGASSFYGSPSSSRGFIRTSVTTSQSSFTRSRTAKRTTETYPRFIFEPLLINSKPIHPLMFNSQDNPTKLRPKTPKSNTLYPRTRPNSIPTPLSDEKRQQLLVSDLSIDENLQNSSTPSPSMIKLEQETPQPKTPTPTLTTTRPRVSTNIQLTSTIKLNPTKPRCRSAIDIKPPGNVVSKNYPRFILIADQEHRIESWYHQYPFILSDDLLTAFQMKSPQQQKTMVSAYFTDDFQSIPNPNTTVKPSLQGKSFNINNDWKKYDVIFISNNIYERIMIYLKTIINLIQLAGKIIKIYQVNHQEDLKKQVKTTCRQLQQENN